MTMMTPARSLATALTLATATLVSGTGPLRAQAAARPEEAVGDFRMLPGRDGGQDAERFPPAQRAQAAATLERIQRLLLGNAAFATPHGFVLRAFRMFNVHAHAIAPGLRYTFSLWTTASPFFLDEAGKLRQFDSRLVGGINLQVNQVDCFLRPIARDAGVAMYAVLQSDLDANGHAANGQSYDHCTVLAKPGRRIWRPVPAERFLRMAIARARAEQDSSARALDRSNTQYDEPYVLAASDRQAFELLKQQDPKAAQAYLDALKQANAARGAAKAQAEAEARTEGGYRAARVDSLQAELAALSPAQRAQPAVADSLWKREYRALAAPGDAGAHRVVELDPGYFDAALPFSTPQLITIDTGGFGRDEPLVQALVESIDWAPIRALLR